jgi:hypothetical protein
MATQKEASTGVLVNHETKNIGIIGAATGASWKFVTFCFRIFLVLHPVVASVQR